MPISDEYDLSPVPEEPSRASEEASSEIDTDDEDTIVAYFRGDLYGGELWTPKHYIETSEWEQERCRPLTPEPGIDEDDIVGYQLDDGRLRFPEHCTKEEKEAGNPLGYADR